MDRTPCLLALLIALSACGGDEENAPTPDAGDGAVDAASVVDVVVDEGADAPIVDTPRIDTSSDVQLADVATPDEAVADASTVDAELVDVASVDVTSVDVSMVDAARADVATIDRVTPVDVRAPDATIDAPRDVATVDTATDVRPVDATIDAPRDVAPVDAPRDVAPVDVPPPPPVCAAAAGGGSATTRAPTMLLALRDIGTESWLAAPAVADLDRDGVNEIIAGRETRVVVWRASGAVRWAAEPSTGLRTWAPPLVGDFIGDANLEVVAAAGDRVVMYTAAGAVAPGFPVRWHDEIRALAAGDLDGDGRPEIVAATTQPASSGGHQDVITAFRANGAVLRGFPPNGTGTSRCDSACDIAGAFDENLAIGPLDGDGLMDIVAPTDNAYISWHRGTGEAFPVAPIFRAVTRSPGVRFFTNYTEAQMGYAMNETTAEQAHFTTGAPVIVDIDGDGSREIVALGSIQNAAQTDRHRGVGLFVVRPDGTRPPAWTSPYQVRAYLAGLEDFGSTNVVGMTNQVAVADIDPASPGMEMIFAGFDGRIWCVGADRSTRWSYQYTTANNVVTAGVVIADLSGDGRPEVVFATYSTARNVSALHVLDARGAMSQRVAIPGRGSMNVPAIADVNRDGTLEIVVSLKDASPDEVLVFTVPGSSTNCAPWPMSRRSLLRDGFVAR